MSQWSDDPPGIDGTPGWAYTEDGYCVCCGNGRWKHHMPGCELRDALDAVPATSEDRSSAATQGIAAGGEAGPPGTKK